MPSLPFRVYPFGANCGLHTASRMSRMEPRRNTPLPFKMKRYHEPGGCPLCPGPSRHAGSARHVSFVAIVCALFVVESPAFAHGIGGQDAAFVAATRGPDLIPFMYL